jgi:hypothetical protein
MRTTRPQLVILLAIHFASGAFSDDAATSSQRVARNQRQHLQLQQRTGILIPMYVYPSDPQTNEAFNRLIDLKRRYETVPFWVIVNPASGPGTEVDPNYTRIIDRLVGAGCMTLGYVSTSYAKRPAEQIEEDVHLWAEFYPRVHGLFFDEMNYEDAPESVNFQTSLKKYGERAGFWPIVANPGTDVPGRFFDAEAADVFVVHEGDRWPTERRLAGDVPGGYGDYPPSTRAVLIHSLSRFDKNSLHVVRKHARWVYITDDLYRLNDPAAPNPWDTLSTHMEAMCEELSK